MKNACGIMRVYLINQSSGGENKYQSVCVRSRRAEVSV